MKTPREITPPETFSRRLARQAFAFRSLLREAVSTSHRDFTEGAISKAIFLLSVPMVLEMTMESLFGIVNVYWVAHLGKEQAAAVGITEFLLTILFAVAIGLSIATTATVARRIGEHDPEAAARVAAQAVFIAIGIAVPLALVGIVFQPHLFSMMNAGPGVAEAGSGYATILFGSNVVIMLLFLLNAVFRGAGDAAIAMRSLWLGNAINLILDPCFIFGLGPFPEMGVTGSAVATTIGRSCAVAYQFYRLFGTRGRVSIKVSHLKWDIAVIKNLIRLSVGGTIQMLVAMSAWIFCMSIVGRFGAAAQAGYTIAIRIVWVTLLPSYGMSNAAATLVGQNLGARKPDRAARSAWCAGHSNAVFLSVISLAMLFWAKNLTGFFTNDLDVIRYGAAAIQYISFGYVFYGYGMVMAQAFNGAGDTLTPTILNFVCFWIIQIPLAYSISSYTPLGAKGVFLAVTIAESASAVLGIACFRQGKWKTRKV